MRHYVGVSIVGIDRVGGRYYKAKLAQEELVHKFPMQPVDPRP